MTKENLSILLSSLIKIGIIILGILAVLPFNTLSFLLNTIALDGNFTLLTIETSAFFRFLFLLMMGVFFALIGGESAWNKLYAFLISLLYSVIFAGQTLGFLKKYHFSFVLPLVLILIIGVYWSYNKYTKDFIKEVFLSEKNKYFLDNSFGVSGVILVLFLLLIPVVIFPYSPISPILNYDVGKYHLPKALELLSTGSSWDMTVSYGAYPYGYESIFSFSALLTRNGYLFGAAQALGNLFFLFTLWFLARRYSRLPSGVLFFFSAFFTTGWVLFHNHHQWRIFNLSIYQVGKNDLFLAASVLAVIFFSPIDTKRKKTFWNPFGMALTSMIAFSVKPNAIIILIPLWLWSLYLYYLEAKNESIPLKKNVFKMIGWGVVILPGLLWTLRNIIAQGTLFYDEILTLQRLSILNNLNNPDFYLHIPFEFFALLALLVLSFIALLLKKQITWSLWLTYLVLFFGFISTPATAFVHSLEGKAYISWRFGIMLLTFSFLLLIIYCDPQIKKLYSSIEQHKILRYLITIVIILGTFASVWDNRFNFYPTQKYIRVLEDQYRESVGVDGYYSAIDYLQKNIKNSVVHIENGHPYYAYGEGFTNSTTYSREADYIIMLQTDWRKGRDLGYREATSEEGWDSLWELIYEDSQGRIYERR